MIYIFDTTAYFLFFQPKEEPARATLLSHIQMGGDIAFCISQISSMEIHSVLGKKCRRQPKQEQICDRTIHGNDGKQKCSNRWIFPGRQVMNKKLFQNMLYAIDNLEKGRTPNKKITIIPLDKEAIQKGTQLLSQYSHQFNFGSHDAIIAGTMIYEQKRSGKTMTMVTSDRGLKAVLQKVGQRVFDPKSPSVS